MLTGDWGRFQRKIRRLPIETELSMQAMVGKEALKVQRIWVTGVSTGVFTFHPNAEVTVVAKGSSRPLIDTRGMLKAIGVTKLNYWEWFIGITRGETNTRTGLDYVDIAFIHEEGKIVRRPGGGLMAMPITSAARSAGYARDFPHPLHRRGKALFDDSGEMHYVLLEVAVIKPRPMRAMTMAAYMAQLPLAARQLGLQLVESK